MPRKDPITGCMVMTLPEFLAEEGKRKGTDGGEILSEIYQEFDEDNKRIENECRKPEVAFSHILEAAKYELGAWQDDKKASNAEHARFLRGYKGEFGLLAANLKKFYENAAGYRKYMTKWAHDRGHDKPRQEPRPPMPKKAIEVMESRSGQNFRGSSSLLVAKVLCEDGKERFARLTASYSSGSFYEPPDEETILEWSDSYTPIVIPPIIPPRRLGH